VGYLSQKLQGGADSDADGELNALEPMARLIAPSRINALTNLCDAIFFIEIFLSEMSVLAKLPRGKQKVKCAALTFPRGAPIM
jgi:hypothetical protein